MKRAGFNIFLAGLIFFSTTQSWSAQAEPLPQFEEIYQLLRTNSSGLSEAELNRAAVSGLLGELESRVVLVTNETSGALAKSNQLSQVSVYEKAFGYFRVNEVESGLGEHFNSSFQQLVSTNSLKGLVLDLRFARGTDYAAAAKLANLFFKKEQPLLRWDGETARATTKTNAISIPVVILANHQTSGAAEALAGMLRDGKMALIIGTNTAGRASVFKTFSLSNGQQVKIATSPVKLGNGQEISSSGLKPDIAVALSAAEEKAFYDDPFYESPKLVLAKEGATNSVTGNSTTNRPRRRLNEAELVRMQREGISVEEFLEAQAEAKPTSPQMTDPALVRALDLLKGLAIITQQNRRN